MTNRESAFSFAVVCEAQADQTTACGLVERIFVHEVEWIDRDGLAGLIHWRGIDVSSRFLAWTEVHHEARRRGIKAHGRYRTYIQGNFDERQGRLALRLFESQENGPDAILLVRDTDGDAEVAPSLEKARSSSPWDFSVILAIAHPKRESWILAGFEPRNADEESRIRELRSELGYDPRVQAERLTAEGRKGKHNAKNVLERLLTPGSAREESCWHETDLDILRSRGQGSGLTAFLQEVSERLVPLLA